MNPTSPRHLSFKTFAALAIACLSICSLRATPMAPAVGLASDQQLVSDPHREMFRDPFSLLPQDFERGMSVLAVQDGSSSIVNPNAANALIPGAGSGGNLVAAADGSVPDGGATIILLGCSLLVLFIFGRRVIA